MEDTEQKSENKKIIGVPAGKGFWIASATIAAFLGLSLASLYRQHSQFRNLEEREFLKPEITKEELRIRIQETHRIKYEEWKELEARKFRSYLNTEQISKEEYQARMRWFQDAKFGIFIHWNPCSSTGREISSIPPNDATYSTFDPEKFNAGEWVKVAKSAGAGYIAYTAKHQDGFCMFDTKTTDFKITDQKFRKAKFRRDVVAELAEACKKEGLKFIVYYSPPDWHNPDFGAYIKNLENKSARERFLSYTSSQIQELVAYPFDGLWFDSFYREDMGSLILNGCAPSEDYYERLGKLWNARKVFELIRQTNPSAIINNRLGLLGDYDTPEQKIGDYDPNKPFESCITLGTQWSWKPNDKIKSLEQCIWLLVNCAGRNGNLLLNVGPNGNGEIESEQANRLKEIGSWLAQYGESIYGTRPAFPPQDWGVSTRNGNIVYLHILRPPIAGVALSPTESITLLPMYIEDKKIKNVALFNGLELKLEQTQDEVSIQIPGNLRDSIDTIVRLELEN